jgi:hypothetical protein
MSRSVLRTVHLVASLAATLSVTVLLTATLLIEPTASDSGVRLLRRAVLLGLPVLVVFLIAAGVSGRRLAGGSALPVLRRKQRRLAVAASAGALALVPCAIALDRLATRGYFGQAFTMLEITESALGAMNLTLLVLNTRDGFRLTRNPR